MSRESQPNLSLLEQYNQDLMGLFSVSRGNIGLQKHIVFYFLAKKGEYYSSILSKQYNRNDISVRFPKNHTPLDRDFMKNLDVELSLPQKYYAEYGTRMQADTRQLLIAIIEQDCFLLSKFEANPQMNESFVWQYIVKNTPHRSPFIQETCNDLQPVLGQLHQEDSDFLYILESIWREKHPNQDFWTNSRTK